MIRFICVNKIFSTLVLVFISSLFFLGYANAQTFTSSVELQGYAWSPNIGWISLNCSNNAECGTSNYKVRITPGKSLIGYAWSANIGWIQFGGLLNHPSGGDYRGNPRVTGTVGNWNFEGWARALTYRDGWDGWISLSGLATDGNTYKMSFGDNGILSPSSYAWGDDVIGWINFSPTFFVPPCRSGNSCTADYSGTEFTDMWCDTQPPVSCVGDEVCTDATNTCGIVIIDGTLTANPVRVQKNGTVQLSWVLDNPLSVDSCKITSNTGGEWTTNPAVSGPLTFNTNIFTLLCIPAGGGPYIEVDTTEVRLLPNIFES